MSFILNTDFAGEIGINPRRLKLVSTDSLATVTAARYLNSRNLGVNVIYPTDVLDVIYSFNEATGIGTFGTFVPSISNDVITLKQQVNYGNVLLPVAANNLPMFNGTTGQVQDSGVAFSNISGFAVTAPGSLTVGNLAGFSDSNGTLSDTGSNLTRVVVPILAAAFNGMYAAPISISAAPGAGKLIVVKQAYLSMTYGTAQFAAGGAISLQYENTVHGAGTAASATIAAATVNALTASTVLLLTGATSVADAAAVNQPLYISNATGAFTTGDSTFKLIVDYSVITV